MKRILLTTLFPLISLCSLYAQETNLDWINKHAVPLNADTASSMRDLSFLSTALKDNRMLGLGEASHGTQEFYNQKKRIIEYLVRHLNYKRLGFEFSSDLITPVDEYIRTGKGNLKELMKDFRLYNTVEIYKLFEYLKTYNNGRPEQEQIHLFGYDKKEYAGLPLERDKLMARNILSAEKADPQKTIIWAHNVHIAKDTTMAQFRAMGYYLKKEYGDKFYALAFDTYKGSVNLLLDDDFETRDFQAGQDSFSALFSKAAYPDFFLSFTEAKNPLKGLIHKVTNIYASWTERRSLPIKAGFDFDGLIFIRESNAAIPVK